MIKIRQRNPMTTFDKLETVKGKDDKCKEIILLDDINYDLARRMANQPVESRAHHMIEVYDLFSFKQLIQEPTRVSLTTSSLIDHIATTYPDNIVDSGVLQVSIRDHYLVYCLGNCDGARRIDHKVIKTRPMKSFEETAFLADVYRINWDRVVSRPVDINVFVDDWSNFMSMIIDKHAPIKSVRVSEKYCIWINKDVKVLIRERDTLKNEAVSDNSSPLMESYRKIRNMVSRINGNVKR